MGETTMTTLITVELESAQPATSYSSTKRENLGRPDLLAFPEGMATLPEWITITSGSIYSSEAAKLASEDGPAIDPAAFQSFELHDYLLHPALCLERLAPTLSTLGRRLHRCQTSRGESTRHNQCGPKFFS